jgi:NADPH-dependent curcumin reductase CurA
MTSLLNRQYRLARRPGARIARDDFDWVEASAETPREGEILVRTRFLSLDPTNKLWMTDVPQYLPPVALGDVMRGGAVAEVVVSKLDGFAPGDLVFGMTGWQDYAVLKPGGPLGLAKLPADTGLPAEDFLGVCGPTGVTAYYGMVDICAPRPGETAIVSAAAGAVGSVAGQLAKIAGARVVGIAGSPDKCRLLIEEFGFDAAVDYKSADWRADLEAATPGGAHILFENVGGAVMDACLHRLRIGGRIALCGLMSAQGGGGDTTGDFALLIGRRLKAQGLNLVDYGDRWPEAAAQLARWVLDGRLKGRTTIVEGLEAAPDALNMLFDGGNVGKLVVRVA